MSTRNGVNPSLAYRVPYLGVGVCWRCAWPSKIYTKPPQTISTQNNKTAGVVSHNPCPLPKPVANPFPNLDHWVWSGTPRPTAIMRPDGEAPLLVADEVGVVLRHAAVVHDLRAARVAHALDGQPPPVVRPQRIAHPQLPRCHRPASQLKPPATAKWQTASTPVVFRN